MILLDLFLNSCWNLLIWVFWRFSCNIWDFWIFIWAMIPNWGWNWESWHNSGQSEIWYCGQSAGNGRTVRRSCDLFTRGSAEKLSTAKIHCEQSAKGPRTVRQRLCRICQRQCQSGCSVKYSDADGPPKDRGQSATGQNGGVGQTWLILDVPLTSPTKPHTSSKRLSLFLSQARGGDDKVKPFWSGSRTVREHPRTLLKIVHHVLSVFQWIPNSCSRYFFIGKS